MPSRDQVLSFAGWAGALCALSLALAFALFAGSLLENICFAAGAGAALQAGIFWRAWRRHPQPALGHPRNFTLWAAIAALLFFFPAFIHAGLTTTMSSGPPRAASLSPPH